MSGVRLIYTSRTSDPAPRPRDACPSGKLGWFNEADARGAMARAQRRRPNRGTRDRQPLSCYECPHGCGSWHLTGWEDGDYDVRRTSR